MKKRKRIHIILAGLFLFILILAGSTIAYLVRETDEVVNRITYASPELDAMLTEPEWDGVIDYEYEEDGKITPIYDYEDEDTPIYGYEGGDKDKPVKDKEHPGAGTKPKREKPYGEDLAEKFLPGMTIPKNPKITNTSSNYEEWVAMRIWFVYAPGHVKEGQPMSQVDYLKVTDVIDITYDTANWEQTGEGVPWKEFYYKETLGKPTDSNKNSGTTPLFTEVRMKPSANNDQINNINQMGGFVIYAEGFASQAQTGDTYADFKAWGVGGGVVFAASPSEQKPVNVEKPGINSK